MSGKEQSVRSTDSSVDFMKMVSFLIALLAEKDFEYTVLPLKKVQIFVEKTSCAHGLLIGICSFRPFSGTTCNPMAWILRLIEEGEHQQQDFKLRIDDSRKIAKTLVAFANSDGGRLLIGVKDNGAISGVNVEEEHHMIQAAATMYSDPPVPYEYQVWQVDYQRVLEVRVEASDRRPHYAEVAEDKWRAYIRREDQVFMANQVILKVWQHQDTRDRWEFEYDTQKEALFHYLQEKGSVGFMQAARITGLDPVQTEDLLAQLVAWEIMEMVPAEGKNKGYTYRMTPESASQNPAVSKAARQG